MCFNLVSSFLLHIKPGYFLILSLLVNRSSTFSITVDSYVVRLPLCCDITASLGLCDIPVTQDILYIEILVMSPGKRITWKTQSHLFWWLTEPQSNDFTMGPNQNIETTYCTGLWGNLCGGHHFTLTFFGVLRTTLVCPAAHPWGMLIF